MTSSSPPGAGLSAAGFQDADAYDRLMGRWSRRLAPLLIGFGALADGERIVDVGCGTGSLTFAFPTLANVAAVTGIDATEPFVVAARARSTDPRITFDVGDARALPYADALFDRAYSSLVLHLVPDAEKVVAEMRRVVRPGGTVVAAVWDNYGGQTFTRILWDIAGVLEPALVRPYFRSLNGPGELAEAWLAAGLKDVEETNLMIRMEFASFDDYWAPFGTGESPHGKYVVGLPEPARETLKHHVRRAYLGNRPDGPRSMVSVAWACRGTVPNPGPLRRTRRAAGCAGDRSSSPRNPLPGGPRRGRP
jgi:SAM-dependent methyltransferase